MNKLHLLGEKNLTLLQHNNAKPHTSVISAAIEIISFEVVPQPLYRPDLEPFVFCLFGAFKKHLKAVVSLTTKNCIGGIVLNERRTR